MKNLSILLLASALSLAAPVQAADQDRDRVQTRDPSTHTNPSQDQEGPQVYGWELMTGKERTQYQIKQMSLKNEKEREAFQLEHHKKMQERAKAQGKTLPDMPQGGGWGVGKGPGPAAPAVSQTQERAYGWDLMTDKERKEYQDRMRSQKTEKDREAVRAEHHKTMQERAKAQGKTLPDMPIEGRGPGMGQGQGKGQGAGKP